MNVHSGSLSHYGIPQKKIQNFLLGVPRNQINGLNTHEKLRNLGNSQKGLVNTEMSAKK